MRRPDQVSATRASRASCRRRGRMLATCSRRRGSAPPHRRPKQRPWTSPEGADRSARPTQCAGRFGWTSRDVSALILRSAGTTSHVLGAGSGGLTDPKVGATPADVADLVEVGVADHATLAPSLVDLGDGGHYLTGLAVAALRDVLVDPGLLHRVQILADGSGQTLDGGDLVGLLDLRHRHGAGVERRAVDVASASLTDINATAVLWAGDAQDVAQHPQQTHVVGDVDGHHLTVELEGVFGHGIAPQYVCVKPSVGDCGMGGTVALGTKPRDWLWLIGKLVGMVPVARV